MSSTAEALFNHLVLPPQLPGKGDGDFEGLSQQFIKLLDQSAATLDNLTALKYHETISLLQKALHTCSELNHGRLDRESLLAAFGRIEEQPLILHVVEQNAALFIRYDDRHDREAVIFEAFEASPPSEQVLKAESALLCTFPGRAAKVPLDIFHNQNFQEALSALLQTASLESLRRFAAKTRKAGTLITEERDTSNPALIIHMLMPLLETLGSPCEVPMLRKRVRDDVIINDSLLPWRRHPLWLILRVTTERLLRLSIGHLEGRTCYKFLHAVLLAHFLQQCAGQLKPELTLLLRSKLCRRMAKLEVERADLTEESGHCGLFDAVGPWLKSRIADVSRQVELVWQNFKVKTTKTIPRLQQRVALEDLCLSLPASGPYLQSLLRLRPTTETAVRSTGSLEIKDEGIRQVQKFTNKYFMLAQLDSDTKKYCECPDVDDSCVEVANRICDYLDTVGDSYNTCPEQTSGYLLNAFDLWSIMDEKAVREHPLLGRYQPVFQPELLDALQLPDPQDLSRLQVIQKYLHDRIKASSRGDIFATFNTPECFGFQFLVGSEPLQRQRDSIEADSRSARDKKEAEWNRVDSECKELSEKMTGLSCLCLFGPDGKRTAEDIKNCKKCFLWRRRNRLKIKVFEEFLPKHSQEKDGLVFELFVPRGFQAYRNVTFRLMRDLAYPTKITKGKTPLKLHEFSQLSRYMTAERVSGGISLCSTSKSFSQTHFGDIKVMRSSTKDVLLPFGPNFQLYDSETGIWVKDLDQKLLTLQHRCGVFRPQVLKNVLPPDPHPPAVAAGPSSYQVIANQRKCPQQASVHEFSACQTLLGCSSQRWINILTALGSSNLNFSNGDTTRLLAELAAQAGPCTEGHGHLRDAFIVFEDEAFCQRLAKQIESRLATVSSNFRETHCMELLISLCERLFSLSWYTKPSRPSADGQPAPNQDHPHSTVRSAAVALLKSARKIASQWIVRLRDEVKTAKDATTAERMTRYAFKAAILARRTFALIPSPLGLEDLSVYCQATIALQEFMVTQAVNNDDPALAAMLIRDTKTSWAIRDRVRNAILTPPKAATRAICEVMGSSEEGGDGQQSSTTFSDWEHFSENWISCKMNTAAPSFKFSQVVHFNFVEGHLLVDRKPLGRLPTKIQDSPEVKSLFGDLHLRTSQSGLSGMSHRLLGLQKGSQVHFGLRGDRVVIRTMSYHSTCEFIPPQVFRRNGVLDLPLHLVEGCVHWLDLGRKCLEIRRRSNNGIWKARLNDWVINLQSHQGTRGAHPKVAYLVDPFSRVAQLVAGIFQDFEQPQRIMLYRNRGGRLSVELPQLELSFSVNRSGALEEMKLGMEVDPSQDAGTLYGLNSKIVLRDTQNTRRRCLLIPFGTPQYRRMGPHLQVTIRLGQENTYLTYGIDPVVGRLTCAPEPPHVYMKAHLHALTSFPLPDPLTGRTGMEECTRTLKSGLAQPWKPLEPGHIDSLQAIARLSPTREFYPEDKRRLQKVTFDKDLTMTVQHDCLEILVMDLIRKSRRLQPFYHHTSAVEQVEPPSHLRLRGVARRLSFEPAVLEKPWFPRDLQYEPGDSDLAGCEYGRNVVDITKSILQHPFSLRKAIPSLQSLLKGKLVGGFLEQETTVLNILNQDPVVEQFGTLVNFSRKQDPDCLYSLAFHLSLLAFDGPTSAELHLLHILVAFGRLDALKSIAPPAHPVFVDFGVRKTLKVDDLAKLMRPLWPECQSGRAKLTTEAFRQHISRCEEECRNLSIHFHQQWPNPQLTMDGFEQKEDGHLINGAEALEIILPTWEKLCANQQLASYVQDVQGVLNQYKTADNSPSQEESDVVNETAPERVYFPSIARYTHVMPSISDLVGKASVASTMDLPSYMSPLNFIDWEPAPTSTRSVPEGKMKELDEILHHFISSPDPLRERYGQDLKRSLNALRQECYQGSGQKPSLKKEYRMISRLALEIQHVRSLIQDLRRWIVRSLASGDGRFSWLHSGNLWPGTDTVTLLEQLRSSARNTYGDGHKEVLVRYGLMITTEQWLNRVIQALLKYDEASLQELLENPGHENWEPIDKTDWLLMEIDAEILVRPQQIRVAHQIISPDSKANSVMQLNMGQGKTSCIVPLAISVLADTSQLVRLICPKALIHTTAHKIQSGLGGLVGRELRQIPFARRTPSTLDMIQLYAELHEEIRAGSGVILTTPDTVLSHRLSAVQRLKDGKMKEARHMMSFSQSLTQGCRDIIDESDLTLGVKTQLIYPSGSQVRVDGAPQRWEVSESLLLLVAENLRLVRRSFPRGIEIVHLQTGGVLGSSFPVAHFLQGEAEDELNRLIVDDICSGRAPFLRPAEATTPFPTACKQRIRRFLTDASDRGLVQDDAELKEVIDLFADKDSAPKILLLLRGLLVSRILLLCLKKRWGVQYGLHPLREPIAVPYEAKGVPSEQAEFGHPDVSIILTILSHFYGGLTLPQFRQALDHVLKSDDPATEYERLISQSITLPEQYRHFYIVNTDDTGQLEELYRHLRLDKHVCIYYLNTFVFPVHAKTFTVKLGASSWDIPLYPKPRGPAQRARTTGFSGTNDNKSLLPMTITQDDLPSLVQTNAEVLTCLLEERNREYQLAVFRGRRCTETELLENLASRRIRVLIDAGAYILEMTNEKLVRTWLETDHEAKAAVYFSKGQARVMYRRSANREKNQPIEATPWASEITNDVLVFFDEASCRGVDLKLSKWAKAALTLAPYQTKDHTVQGAMRLRQLATTQSVVFMGPPEVDASIRDVCRIPRSHSTIHSGHVVRWLLEMTCRGNEQLQNLHVAQGIDFCLRRNAQWENPQFLTREADRSKLLSIIESEEHQTLERQYGPATGPSIDSAAAEVSFPCLQSFVNRLVRQRNAMGGKLDGKDIQGSALEEVEQEREVEFQVEEVRQISKPVKCSALCFPGLSPVILTFVRTGELDGPAAYMHAFDSLGTTEIGSKFGVRGTGSRFYCSTEFARTVALGKKIKHADNFLRPVEWVLFSKTTETALIIIPEEADKLIPVIRRAGPACPVHLIAYAAPVTKKMAHFNDLRYYTVPTLPPAYIFPAWFRVELGIFAGRLYVPYDECAAIEDYLQPHKQDGGEEDDKEPQAASLRRSFADNPVAFLLEWLALRRQVQDVLQTPMGYILQGRRLSEDHPFFSSSAVDAVQAAEMRTSTASSGEMSNLDDGDEEEEDGEDGWSEVGEQYSDVDDKAPEGLGGEVDEQDDGDKALEVLDDGLID